MDRLNRIRTGSCSAPWRAATRAPLRFALSVILLATLGAGRRPAGMWPMYQLRPSHEAVRPGLGATSWQRSLHGKVNGGLAIAGGKVFVESFNRRVSALDARTGRLIWSTPLPDVAMTTPLVAAGLVVVGTGTNRVLVGRRGRTVWGRPGGDRILALNAQNGRIVWQRRTVGEDMPTAALARTVGQLAIIGANGHDRIKALSLATGRTLWTRPTRGIATMSSAAVAGGRLYVIVGGGPRSGEPAHLDIVALADGRVVQRAYHGNADCSPAVSDGLVALEGAGWLPGKPADQATYSTVSVVSARTGALRWRWRSRAGRWTTRGSNEQAVAGLIHRGTLYQAIPVLDEVRAFSVADGEPLWRLRTAAPVKMSAVVNRGRLYVGDTAGYFYVVNARSGHLIARVHFPQIFTISPPLIDGSTLYVANDRTVYAIPLAKLRAMHGQGNVL
ncbi:MAG: outer membrane protein assembly factor BamB family protein [Vulcanimicrobiaceae bacterium]